MKQTCIKALIHAGIYTSAFPFTVTLVISFFRLYEGRPVFPHAFDTFAWFCNPSWMGGMFVMFFLQSFFIAVAEENFAFKILFQDLETRIKSLENTKQHTENRTSFLWGERQCNERQRERIMRDISALRRELCSLLNEFHPEKPESPCSVCLETRDMVRLPCFHKLCRECVFTQGIGECPFCRSWFNRKDVVGIY